MEKLIDVDVSLLPKNSSKMITDIVKPISNTLRVQALQNCQTINWGGNHILLEKSPQFHDVKSQYVVNDDRGPGAIDAAQPRRTVRDQDVKDTVIVNDPFTPPLYGYPLLPPAEAKRDAPWALKYIEVIGEPKATRETAYHKFMKAFLHECTSFATVLVRKTALPDLHKDTGSFLVSSKYSSTTSVITHRPRREVNEVALPLNTTSGTTLDSSMVQQFPALASLLPVTMSFIQQSVGGRRGSQVALGKEEEGGTGAAEDQLGVDPLSSKNESSDPSNVEKKPNENEGGETKHQPTRSFHAAAAGVYSSCAHDKNLESAPVAQMYLHNGVMYEICNNRAAVCLMGSHENSLKYASHRLHGLEAVARQDIPFLHYLPSVLVEYCGYKVWCSVVPPTDESSPIVYGSRCGGSSAKSTGVTITTKRDPYKRTDIQALACVKELGRRLNVKPHHCGASDSRQFLYSNGDFCVQRALDNRLYVTSGTERLSPPIATNNVMWPNGYLYRRFRFELLLSSRKNKDTMMPISSDVFSNFGIIRCEEHDREAAMLTEILKTHVLNDCANKMVHILMKVKTVQHGYDLLQVKGTVSGLMHRFGVNVRYLGELVTRLSQRYYRIRAKQPGADGPEFMLPIAVLVIILRTEMIARALKLLIRRLMRNRSFTSISMLMVGALRILPQLNTGGDNAEGADQQTDPVGGKDEGKKVGEGGAENVKAPKLSITEPEDKNSPSTATTNKKPVPSSVRNTNSRRPIGKKGGASGKGGARGKKGGAGEIGGPSLDEEYYTECFEKVVWPVIEAKFGKDEGFALMPFHPRNISIFSQLDEPGVFNIDYIVESVIAKTGVCFVRLSAASLFSRYAGGLADRQANTSASSVDKTSSPAAMGPSAGAEPIPIREVAREIADTRLGASLHTTFAASDPFPVIRSIELPPCLYPNGEIAHILGVARSYVSAVSLAENAKHLARPHCQVLKDLAYNCSKFCIQQQLTTDEHVIHWLRLFEEQQGLNKGTVTTSSTRNGDSGPAAPSSSAAAMSSADQEAMFYLPSDVIVYPTHRNDVVKLVTNISQVAFPGIKHGQRLVMNSKKVEEALQSAQASKVVGPIPEGFRPKMVILVLGELDGFLYVTEEPEATLKFNEDLRKKMLQQQRERQLLARSKSKKSFRRQQSSKILSKDQEQQQQGNKETVSEGEGEDDDDEDDIEPEETIITGDEVVVTTNTSAIGTANPAGGNSGGSKKKEKDVQATGVAFPLLGKTKQAIEEFHGVRIFNAGNPFEQFPVPKYDYGELLFALGIPLVKPTTTKKITASASSSPEVKESSEADGTADKKNSSERQTMLFKKRDQQQSFFDDSSDEDESGGKDNNKQSTTTTLFLAQKFGHIYFFGPKWSIIQYRIIEDSMESFRPGLRAGQRVLSPATGSTFRIIGEAHGHIWVCQERIDALPRIMNREELQEVRIVHSLPPLSYSDEKLHFQGKMYTRQASLLANYGLFFGHKIACTRGPLIGMVGIVLGICDEQLQLFNMKSRETFPIPGRNKKELFELHRPILIGAVLDLEVFHPIEPTLLEVETANGNTVTVDHRGGTLLPEYGVLHGCKVEVMKGRFAPHQCVVYGAAMDRLWVKLLEREQSKSVNTNANSGSRLQNIGLIPLRRGEYRALSDEVPQEIVGGMLKTKTTSQNNAATNSANDDSINEGDLSQLQLHGMDPSDVTAFLRHRRSVAAQNIKSSSLVHKPEPFLYLSGFGLPIVFDRSDVLCGRFGIFHGQRITIARDLFDTWKRFTVVGMFQNEIWAVEDGAAAAVPLLGVSATEMLQIYSVCDVVGHQYVRPFQDFLHIEGTPITPSTRFFLSSHEHLACIITEDLDFIGVDTTKEAVAEQCRPHIPIQGGDRIEVIFEKTCYNKRVPDHQVTPALSSVVESQPHKKAGDQHSPENDVFLSPQAHQFHRRPASPPFLYHPNADPRQTNILRKDIWEWKTKSAFYIVVGCFDGVLYGRKETEMKCCVLEPRVIAMAVIESRGHPVPHCTLEDLLELRAQEHRIKNVAPSQAKSLYELKKIYPQVSNEGEEIWKNESFVEPNDVQRLIQHFQKEYPKHSSRLVLHWVLSWFNCSLKFSEKLTDGCRKLAIIEQFVWQKPLELPSMAEYKSYRQAELLKKELQENRLDITADKYLSLKETAYAFSFDNVKDGHRAARALRTLPALRKLEPLEEIPASILQEGTQTGGGGGRRKSSLSQGSNPTTASSEEQAKAQVVETGPSPDEQQALSNKLAILKLRSKVAKATGLKGTGTTGFMKVVEMARSKQKEKEEEDIEQTSVMDIPGIPQQVELDDSKLGDNPTTAASTGGSQADLKQKKSRKLLSKLSFRENQTSDNSATVGGQARGEGGVPSQYASPAVVHVEVDEANIISSALAKGFHELERSRQNLVAEMAVVLAQKAEEVKASVSSSDQNERDRKSAGGDADALGRHPITRFRYKAVEGNVIYFESADRICYDVFGMRRGEIYRYTDTDLVGVHFVVLGVYKNQLWRYEETIEQSPIIEELARPFFGKSHQEITAIHPVELVGNMTPRESDLFYFPKADGRLQKFNITEEACMKFGVVHGRRYLCKKLPPPTEGGQQQSLFRWPQQSHGPIITVIGTDSDGICFTVDESGAFAVQSNVPIKDLDLEPLYTTTVLSFSIQKSHWFRCPLQFELRPGKKTVAMVNVDTNPDLLSLWGDHIYHGALIKYKVPRQAAALPTQPSQQSQGPSSSVGRGAPSSLSSVNNSVINNASFGKGGAPPPTSSTTSIAKAKSLGNGPISVGHTLGYRKNGVDIILGVRSGRLVRISLDEDVVSLIDPSDVPYIVPYVPAAIEIGEGGEGDNSLQIPPSPSGQNFSPRGQKKVTPFAGKPNHNKFSSSKGSSPSQQQHDAEDSSNIKELSISQKVEQHLNYISSDAVINSIRQVNPLLVGQGISGFSVPKPGRIKALNGFNKLCLFDRGEDSLGALFGGLKSGDVLLFDSGSGVLNRKCIVYGVRNELLWKVDITIEDEALEEQMAREIKTEKEFFQSMDKLQALTKTLAEGDGEGNEKDDDDDERNKNKKEDPHRRRRRRSSMTTGPAASAIAKINSRYEQQRRERVITASMFLHCHNRFDLEQQFKIEVIGQKPVVSFTG